jgi:hypothetical protein
MMLGFGLGTIRWTPGLAPPSTQPTTGHKTSYGPGAYQMTWLIELGQGKHEVKIVITQNTGGVLEYSWHFYIVSEDTINIAIIGLCILLLAAIVAFYFHRINRQKV